jgi:hypothetical protein
VKLDWLQRRETRRDLWNLAMRYCDRTESYRSFKLGPKLQGLKLHWLTPGSDLSPRPLMTQSGHTAVKLRVAEFMCKPILGQVIDPVSAGFVC